MIWLYLIKDINNSWDFETNDKRVKVLTSGSCMTVKVKHYYLIISKIPLVAGTFRASLLLYNALYVATNDNGFYFV